MILEEDEISVSATENSVCCDSCSTWWQCLPCADLTMNAANALDSWVCQSCLADAANANDTDDDDLEFTLSQESEEPATSDGVNHVCPVC